MNRPPEKRFASAISYIPDDLIFKILLLLPAKDLFRIRSVCKTWRRLINSANFVETHMNKCETVLSFLIFISERGPDSFSIETKQGQFSLFQQVPSRKSEFYFRFLELNDGNAKISDPKICGFEDVLATCNGLVLAINKKRGIVVMNPTTQKLMALKPGTIVPHGAETYGFVFDHHSSEYKVVHIFRDELGHSDSEILSLTTRSWRAGDVPAFGLFRDFKHKAVAASGVLYWLPGTHSVTYLVYMDMNDEKFFTKALPINHSGMDDGLVEIQGFLSYVAQMTVYRIQLWTLKRNNCQDEWVKWNTINMDYHISGLAPVFSTRNGRCLVFKQSQDTFYVYDFEEEDMDKVMVDKNGIVLAKSFFPHASTLASWINTGPLW